MNEKQLLKNIVDACLFLFDNQLLFKAWNVENEQDFYIHKAPVLFHFLKEKKIHIKYLAQVPARLTELTYIPQINDILRLTIPKHDYKMLFNQCTIEYRKYCDYFNSSDITQNLLDELNKLSIIFYNVSTKMYQLKSISILNAVYEDCKHSFKEIYDLVDNMETQELDQVPMPILKLERKQTQEDINTAKFYTQKIKEILSEITENFTAK